MLDLTFEPFRTKIKAGVLDLRPVMHGPRDEVYALMRHRISACSS